MSEGPQLVVRWWVLGLRGLAALGLGMVAFFWPERTFEVLVLLFGVLLVLLALRLARWRPPEPQAQEAIRDRPSSTEEPVQP